MTTARSLVLGLGCLVALTAQALAQPPGTKPADDSGRDKARDYSNAPIVQRMMAFDKNKDGKLTRDEITDERLLRLFDRADANKDGVVTKEELMELARKEAAEQGEERGGPGGGRGGPPGGGGPGGPPFGGPPRPGQVLPPFLQDRLNLTDDQKKQLDALQKDVDSKLDKILTDDQRKQLREMRERGPGGRGPGGPPPGGPPPGGPGERPGQPDQDR